MGGSTQNPGHRTLCENAMQASSSRCTPPSRRPGSEIEEVRRVTVDDAMDMLSYRPDRALLRAFDLAETG